MLSVQQIYDIAAGYAGAMADAMVAACMDWFCRHDVTPLDPRRPGARASLRVDRDVREHEGVDWERLVIGNRGIRPEHV